MKAMILRAALPLAFASLLASPAKAQTTDAVWSHHIAAWNERDLTKLVADYDEQSVVVVNHHVFRGQAGVRKAFTQLFKIFDDGQNNLDAPTVLDGTVYITWHFAPTGRETLFGSDTFVIRDGKIALQTIASPLYEVEPVTE